MATIISVSATAVLSAVGFCIRRRMFSDNSRTHPPVVQVQPMVQPVVVPYPMVYHPNQYARESSYAYNIPPDRGGGGGGGGADAEIGFYGGRGEMGPSK